MSKRRRLVALLSVALAIAAGVRVHVQRPSFTAKTDAILVDVLVTAKGRPVTDLSAADFTVRDNGVPQQVELLSGTEVPQNLFLVIDSGSESVVRAFERFERAVGVVVGRLDARDRVALLSFSHRIQLLSPLTTDRPAILQRFVPIAPDRHSAVADALFATALLSRGEPGRSIALVFTQGADSASWLSDADVFGVVKRSNLLVYGVTLRRPQGRRIYGFTTGSSRDGITIREDFDRTYSSRVDGGNGDVLRRAADVSGGRVIDGDAAGLDEILAGVVDDLRARYVLAFTPSAPTPGWHELSVRVARKGLTVSARRGYFVPR